MMERTRLLSSEKIIFLRNTDLCAGLPVEVIEAISNITEEHNYKADEVLFHKGDIGGSLYLNWLMAEFRFKKMITSVWR